MPNRVYIAYTGFNEAIYRSDEYGAAPIFRGRHPGLLFGPRFAASSDGETLYSGEIDSGNASLNVGANGGQSWNTVYPGPFHPDVTSIATLTSGRVYVGTDGGLWLLEETEDEWQNLNGDMANLLLNRVFTSRGATGALVGGTQDNGVIIHRGTGWIVGNAGDFSDAFLRADNANIGAVFGGGLHNIDGNSASFLSFSGPCERPAYGQWAIDPMDPKFVCAATGTLHCSSVGGRDPWCIETVDLKARELIIVDSSHAWLATTDGHVLRTTTGVTGDWEDVTGDLPIGNVLGIDAPERGDPLHALVLVYTSNLDPLVYETTKGGGSWTPRGVPPVLSPGGVPLECQAPPCPDGPESKPQVLSFAVTFPGPMYNDSWFVGTDTGLLESWDFGNTWVPTNLPNVEIKDLDTFGGVVTVGTWGRGVYQRDVTLRELEFHFVAYDPFWWLRHSPVELPELWASDLFALSDALLEEVRAPQDGGMAFRRGDETHGPLDFYITPGMPLLVRGETSGELTLNGPTAAPRAVHLEPGWNPVGILDPAIGSASQVIADAASQGLSLGVVLDGGAQQSYVPAIGSAAQPVDFDIDPTGGIWVFACGEGGVWIPGGSLPAGGGADPVGGSTAANPTVAGVATCPDPLAALATLPSDLASRLTAELLICVPEQFVVADGALTPICDTAPILLTDTRSDNTACASQPHSHGCAVTIRVTDVQGDAAGGQLTVEFDAVANGRATLVDGATCPIDATAMDGMLVAGIASEIDAPVIHLSVVDAAAPGLVLSQESCGSDADAAIGEVLSTAVAEALATEVTLRVRGLGPVCSPDFDTALIDADGDGTLDCDDACPQDANKIAPGACGCGVIDDFDGDGFVSCGADCDDQDGSIWSTPGEVRELMLGLDPASGGTLLSWSAPVEPGGTVVRYDTLVASSAVGFDSDGTCLESDDGDDTVALFVDLPLPGGIRYLLVRAETGCDPGAGPLGIRSDGAERSGRPCP